VLLGASSYALYLLHVSLIVMLSEFLSPMLRLILQLPVLIAISVGVLILVEEPARRWLRFWLGERPAT
jgi:peptidoglycan/LPS O-acetylase OafA/YrhL